MPERARMCQVPLWIVAVLCVQMGCRLPLPSMSRLVTGPQSSSVSFHDTVYQSPLESSSLGSVQSVSPLDGGLRLGDGAGGGRHPSGHIAAHSPSGGTFPPCE